MINPQLIVEECYKRLPASLKNSPWEVTDHGRAVLQTDNQLNAYLAAYGEVHIVKCLAAIQNLPLEQVRHYNYEIFDWGCGQGLASLVLVDYLAERNLLGNLQQITLIEPSNYAIKRAEKWLRESVGPGIKIKTVNKPISINPSIGVDEITCLSRVSINLFSNILDVQSVNLKWLAEKTASLADINYMICVGPKFSYNTRIKDFCGYFNPAEYFSNIESSLYGYTTRTHHPFSCETKCFIHNRNSKLNSQYKETADTHQYEEYDFATNYYTGLLDEDIVKLYAKLINWKTNSYDVFIHPTIGVDKLDFIITGISKGIILLNICRDINDLDIIWQRLEKLKSFLRETHLRNIKIDTILDKRVYGCIKTAIYFKNTNEEDVEKYISQSENDFNYLIKFYPTDNIPDKINKLYSASFKYDYYKELVDLIIGKWHSYRDGNTNFHLSDRQKEIVRSDSQRIRVKGVAGSGKTQVIANKAVERHIKTGAKVLILTYNIALIEYIRMRINQVPADFSTSMFEITNYHQFFSSMANRYSNRQLIKEDDSDNPIFFEPYKNDIEKYHTIIIDEAQDFESTWLESIIKYFLAEDGCIAIFGDGEQNIYNRQYEQDTNMPKVYGFSGPWREMSERISYRLLNPQIITIASAFANSFLNNKTLPLQTTNEIVFDRYVTKYWNIGRQSDVNIICEKIDEVIQNEGITSKDVVILSNYYHILRDVEYVYRSHCEANSMLTFETKEQYEQLKINNAEHLKEDLEDIRRAAKVHFTILTDGIKYASIQSFKGWESNTIILIIPTLTNNFQDNVYAVTPQENINALIYTAITRARQNLFVINLGNAQYDSFFQLLNN